MREEARINQTLMPFGRAALEKLALRSGESVVDVGCGTGQTLLDLASAVGSSGHVLGVDVSETMAEGARQRIGASKLSNVEVIVGDAERHPFAPERYEPSR